MIARYTGHAALVLTILAAPTGLRAEPFSLQQALGDPEGLTINASVRARYEVLDGQFRPGLDENDDLVTFRSTLFAEYDTGPIRIGAELIDARAYAADAGSSVGTGEVNALELVQAYVGIDLDEDDGDGSSASVDLGRFTMNLGSRRLVGRNNFRNTTNAFTGARFEATDTRGAYYTAFFTLPHSRLPSDKASILDNDVEWDQETTDLTFWGGFTNQPNIFGGVGAEFYFFALDETDSPTRATRDRQIYSPGLRIYREPAENRLDFEVETLYQFGSISASSTASAPERDVSAHFVHADLGWTFPGAWRPHLVVEYDLASGDDGQGSYNRFDSLYGPRRFDWGPTGIYGPLGRNNISSPGVRLEVRPSSRWDGFVGYRAAWLESSSDSFASTGVRDPAGNSGSFAGHQVEARARYWIVPRFLRLDFGGAVLFPGEFLKNAPNASGNGTTTYGYVDVTATF